MEKSCKKCALEASQDPLVYNPKQALHASNYIHYFFNWYLSASRLTLDQY